jgi:hypothetical protein
MKKLNILLSLVIVLTSCNGTSQNKLKRYNVKSGIVKYTTTISGKMMGSTITGSGTESLFFKDYGAVELKESESTKTTTMKFFGRKKVETAKEHTINKLDNGKNYLVDFKTKTITENRDPAMDLMKQTNTDAGEAGKSMLESMGGKKVGNETYKDHNCEVWEFPGGKQWIYKGVMLKLDMKVLGIRNVTEATSIKFNASVPSSNFKLPDFPIQKAEGFIGNNQFNSGLNQQDTQEGMEQVSKLSFDEWKKLAIKDPEMQGKSEKELHQIYDMIKKMAKMGLGN